MVDMGFGERKYFADIFGPGDSRFDIPEGEQFLPDDLSEAFGDLPLPFGKYSMQGETEYLSGLARMEQQFQCHPDGQPVNKGGDKGNGVQPPAKSCHCLYLSLQRKGK